MLSLGFYVFKIVQWLTGPPKHSQFMIASMMLIVKFEKSKINHVQLTAENDLKWFNGKCLFLKKNVQSHIFNFHVMSLAKSRAWKVEYFIFGQVL